MYGYISFNKEAIMISRIQSCNSNINFQSRIHMDWHTAQFLELKGKEESVTGEFKKQLTKLRNNKEHDVVILKRLDALEEDGFQLDVVTKEGHHGTSIVDNFNKPSRAKIDILGMYNEAKNSLKSKIYDTVGFEALNI